MAEVPVHREVQVDVQVPSVHPEMEWVWVMEVVQEWVQGQAEA